MTSKEYHLSIRPFGSHIPCLDGVRGIAILLVMCTHLLPREQLPWAVLEYGRKILEQGWIGVDLFFVLSGFLITGILLDAKNSEHALFHFLARRTLRIFPLYFAVLFIGLIALPSAGMLYEGSQKNVDNQWWLWTYTTNIGIIAHQDWIFDAPEFALNHLWSLAIEEHFYLVWPLLVFSVSSRALVRLMYGGILFAFLLRVTLFLGGCWPITNYVFTLCRMDSLLMGAALAFLVRTDISHRRLRFTAWCLGSVSLVYLLLTLWATKGLWIRHWSMQMVGFSALGGVFVAGMCLLLTSSDSNPWKRLAAISPLVILGRYSYGLYVYHSILAPYVTKLVPDDYGVFHGTPIAGSLSVLTLRIACVLPVAFVSFHCFESQFLRLKKHFPVMKARKHLQA